MGLSCKDFNKSSTAFIFSQVAHFEPQTIHLYGEGVFPRINLNLPCLASERPEVGGDYQRLLAAAKENLTNIEKKVPANRPASVMSDLDEANGHQVQRVIIWSTPVLKT